MKKLLLWTALTALTLASFSFAAEATVIDTSAVKSCVTQINTTTSEVKASLANIKTSRVNFYKDNGKAKDLLKTWLTKEEKLAIKTIRQTAKTEVQSIVKEFDTKYISTKDKSLIDTYVAKLVQLQSDKLNALDKYIDASKTTARATYKTNALILIKTNKAIRLTNHTKIIDNLVNCESLIKNIKSADRKALNIGSKPSFWNKNVRSLFDTLSDDGLDN